MIMGSLSKKSASSQVEPTSNRNLQILNRLLVVLLFGGMLFHLATLTEFPTVFIDEAWLSNAAWTWLKTGVNFDTIHTGVLDQFGNGSLARFFVGELPYVLSFNFLGLGVFQARLVSWFFGCILLFMTVLAGRRLHSLTVGLLAAVFLMLSLQFLQASRWRQDIMLTVFVMLAFWLALVALQDDKLWAHFLAGFLLGIGLDVHQSSTLFIPALAGLYLAYYGKKVIVKPGTWVVGVGGAVGLAIFAIIHILPSPETYNKLMSFNFVDGAQAVLPISHPGTLLSSLIGELGRYGFRRNLVDLALIASGGIWLLKRRSKADILLLIFTGIGFIDFVLLSGDKTNLYAIHLYPFFMLIVANLFVSFLNQVRQSRNLRLGGVLAVVLYMSYGTFQLGRAISTTQGYNYYDVTDAIRTVLPPQARVMGMPTWWFGLAEYEYRSSLGLTYYQFFNGYDVTKSLEVIRPDFIIMDATQGFVLQAEGEDRSPSAARFAVSEEQFLGFLESQGKLVLSFDNPYHGYFEIYAINWDDAS